MITPSFSLTATERVLPKLALDFTTASLDSRITFTRTTGASNPATYVNSSGYVTGATDNQPRFDYDPVTLLCKGLLIEESRTNLYTYSSTFTNVIWIKGASVTLTSGQSGSPSNSADATRVQMPAGAGTYLYQRPTLTAQSYTLSIYARKRAGSSDPFFRLGATVPLAQLDNTTSVVCETTDNWQRFTYTFLATSASWYVGIDALTASSNAMDIEIWGAQLEVGAFATSYIPTTTAALTRNADVATMTGTNFSSWFNASEGSAVIQVLPSTISGTRPAVEFDDNTVNKAIVLRGVAADPQLYVIDGGAAQATLDAGTVSANTIYRLSGAWKSANFATAVNGGATVSQLSGTYPTVTQARLGSDGTNYLNGWLQNFRYWPQRITNAETQAFSK